MREAIFTSHFQLYPDSWRFTCRTKEAKEFDDSLLCFLVRYVFEAEEHKLSNLSRDEREPSLKEEGTSSVHNSTEPRYFSRCYLLWNVH